MVRRVSEVRGSVSAWRINSSTTWLMLYSRRSAISAALRLADTLIRMVSLDTRCIVDNFIRVKNCDEFSLSSPESF